MSKDIRGVEGLPMRLVIISVVAAAAIGILVMWLSGIGADLAEVEYDIDGEGTDPEPLEVGETYDITVIARDDDGSRMEDIHIRLNGADVDEGGTTGEEDGDVQITFEDITPQFEDNIDIEAEDPDADRVISTSIMVID